MKLFEVFGVVKIDSNDADNKLDKTESKGSKLGKTFGKFGKVAAVGIGVASAAIVGFATKAASATDRIDKMSQSIGISRKGFQEWDFITSQSGTSMDTLQTGMKTLTQRAQELKEGTGEGAKSFAKLGISMKDIQGLSQEEILELTVQSLQSMPEGAEKAALSMDLLGKAGQDMAPLLNSSSDSIENMKKQANDLGLVLGDDAIDAGVEFTDTMDKFKRSIGSVVSQLGVKFMPMLNTMLSWVIDHMPEIQKVMSKVFEVIGVVVNKLVDITKEYLIPVIVAVYKWVVDNMPTIQAVFETVFNAIKAVVKVFIDVFEQLLWPILKSVFGWIKDNMPAIKKTFEVTFDVIKKVIEIAVGIIKVYIEILKTVFKFVKDVFSGIGDFFIGAFDGVISFVEGLIDIFDKLFGIITDVVNAIKKFFGFDSGVSDKYKELSNNRSKSTPSGRRAIGGNVTKDASYIVNELEQEIFTPSQNGTITPLSDLQSNNSKKEETVKYILQEGAINVTIPVEDLKEINDINDFFKRLPQLRRGIV